MLAKQILFISVLFPFIEYYSYVAVDKVIHKVRKPLKRKLWILYIVLSIAAISGILLFRLWATTAWPSAIIKTVINLLLGVFIGKFLIAAITLVGDMLVLVKAGIRLLFALPQHIKGKRVKGNLLSRSEFIAQTALVCGGLFTASLGYGMTNKYRYRIRYTRVAIKDLPHEFRNFRILQISDIHAGSFDNRDAVAEGIELASAENPNLILFTGDLVNYRSEEIADYLDIFRKLQAPLGVYSILGNHDYGDYLSWPTPQDKQNDFDKLKNFHRAMGWQLLMNEHVILPWKSAELALIGVENWSIKDRFPKYGDINKAMAGLENNQKALKILMTHDPSHWDAKVRPGYPDIPLTFSGHTHGMQMGIDIPGIKWSPAQYLYKQWAGLYRENEQYLYVNRGFGFIGYDGRIGILPEIAVIELV